MDTEVLIERVMSTELDIDRPLFAKILQLQNKV